MSEATGWVGSADPLDRAANVAVHGVAGGISSIIQGGNFQSGFLSAGFSEFAGPMINKLPLQDLGKGASMIVGGVARGAVGGAASVLGGGKFENGAITASFQYMYNHLYHELTRDAYGLHMRLANRNDKGELQGAISLGRAPGVEKGLHLLYEDFLGGALNEGYASGKEGNGEIRVENRENQWLSIRILSTTPEEDRWVLSQWAAQNGKTGPYNIPAAQCWKFGINEEANTIASILGRRYGVNIPMGALNNIK